MWSGSLNARSRRSRNNKNLFQPFDGSYSYHANEKLLLLATFVMIRTPSTLPSNWNEYTEFLCRVLDLRESTQNMRKAASKMLAAIVNKNDEIDMRVWETIEKHGKDQDEKSLTLAVWIAKDSCSRAPKRWRLAWETLVDGEWTAAIWTDCGRRLVVYSVILLTCHRNRRNSQGKS